jgi:predicted outer membrane protein
MITLTMAMFLAGAAVDQTTLPRHPDPDPVQQQRTRAGIPTDPLFDRAQVATDDPTFVASALENSRQGLAEARSAREVLKQPTLRDAAAKIGDANDSTTRTLETLAKRKGWRLPEGNPQRESTLAAATEARSNANFIIGQLSWHQTTIDQYRAQIAGKGDPELKRALRAALPRYERNRDLLLTLKP